MPAAMLHRPVPALLSRRFLASALTSAALLALAAVLAGCGGGGATGGPGSGGDLAAGAGSPDADASNAAPSDVAATDITASDAAAGDLSPGDGAADDLGTSQTDAAGSDGTAPGADGGGSTVPETLYGLPVIDIDIDPQELDTMHELFDDNIQAIVGVTMFGVRYEGVEFELHGGYARTVPKKSYRLEFSDASKPTVDLFSDGDVDDHRRFVLAAAWIDPTYVRQKITMDVLRKLGGLAPRVDFANLYLNGQWHGLYQVIERIDKPYLKRQGLNRDGNLYKGEDDSANWQAKSNPLKGFEVVINEDNPTDDLGELRDALTYTPTTFADFQAAVEPVLELDEFHVWQMVHTCAMNRDTFTKNYFLYHDIEAAAGTPKARFRVITWDTDATWGINWDGAPLPTDEQQWHGTDNFSPRLYTVDEYLRTYRARYLEALDGDLSPAAMKLRVAAAVSRVRNAAEADLERWDRQVLLDEAVGALNGAIEERAAAIRPVIEGL